MICNRLKISTFSAIVILYIVFTYLPVYGFWIAPAASLAIIMIARAGFGNLWKEYTGLQFSIGDVGRALAFLVFTAIATWYSIRSTAGSAGMDFNPSLKPLTVHTVAQTFNEEIVLGAMIMLYLKRRFNDRHGLILSLGIAFLFSLLHVLFYAFIVSRDPGWLIVHTLFNLFLAGLIRNYFIFRTGHILYAWALHLGFNGLFFSRNILAGGREVPEYILFNTFVGTWQITALLTVICLFMMFPYRKFV